MVHGRHDKDSYHVKPGSVHKEKGHSPFGSQNPGSGEADDNPTGQKGISIRITGTGIMALTIMIYTDYGTVMTLLTGTGSAGTLITHSGSGEKNGAYLYTENTIPALAIIFQSFARSEYCRLPMYFHLN